MSALTIRPATAADIPQLGGIWHDAAQIYLTVDMPEIAAVDPLPERDLLAATSAGRLRIAEANGGPVGYILTTPLVASIHIEQVTVHPTFVRLGAAQQLIAAVAEPGRALTVIAWRDLPWGRPWYERLGFEVVEDPLPGELAALLSAEAASGRGRWPQVVMRRLS